MQEFLKLLLFELILALLETFKIFFVLLLDFVLIFNLFKLLKRIFFDILDIEFSL